MRITALLLLAGLAIPASASAQGNPQNSLDVILARLTSIEKRLSGLERQLGVPPPAAAADASPAAETPDIASRLEALDQQIRIVDRKRELDQEAQTTKQSAASVVEAGRDGFVIRSSDSSFQFKLGGMFQADGRFFAKGAASDVSTLVLRRIRPIFSGTVYKYIDFRIMPDFGLGTTVLQDASLDFRYFPKASVRFGKFKIPFGMERLQSASDLSFVERSLATNLVPNRDLGIVVYGDLASGTFSYTAGVMNGVPDLGSADTDTNSGKDLVARVFAQPWSGLGFGLAATHGRQDGTALPTYKSGAQSSFFYATGTEAAGRRQRISPQAYYYHGPFGVLAEYAASQQSVRKASTSEVMTNTAWQVASTYFLTGENKSFRSAAPISPLDRATGGKGAVELAARYAVVNVDPSAIQHGFADATRSAEQAQEWTAGVNWHVNRSDKFVLDYEQTHFSRGAAAGSRRTEKAILTRFQVAF